MPAADSFSARSTLDVGGERYEIFRLDALQAASTSRGCRTRCGSCSRTSSATRTASRSRATTSRRSPRWVATAEPSREISFAPARVLLQDFTGVPAVVDLAAMRDAMRDLGGDPARINPLHPGRARDRPLGAGRRVRQRGSRSAATPSSSSSATASATPSCAGARGAFDNFKVVPPSTGIVHQVNLEFLARVIESRDGKAFPDTLVGTDSHTTMVNGLGVLGWGVGGIEAEAAMLGEALSMLVPQVVGFRLSGELPEGATATDLVLTVTADPAPDGRGREVRRVLRPRSRRRCRSPTARRSGTCRRSTARRAASSRSTR